MESKSLKYIPGKKRMKLSCNRGGNDYITALIKGKKNDQILKGVNRVEHRSVEEKELHQVLEKVKGIRDKFKLNTENCDTKIFANLADNEKKMYLEHLEKMKIKSNYLGYSDNKKKQQKPSEKFRLDYTFDWDASEDTEFNGTNLYQDSKHDAELLFGRGYQAGYDIREQRKAHTYYDNAAKKRLQQDLKNIKEADNSNDGKSQYTKSLYQNSEINYGVISSEDSETTGDHSENNEYTNVETIKNKINHTAQDDKITDTQKKDKINFLKEQINRIGKNQMMKIYDYDENHLHWSDKILENMTDRDWTIFREDKNIKLKGSRIPNPFRTWNESGIPKQLLQNIVKMNYTTPTAIQVQAIPAALKFRDVIGIAETGSGKTAAFTLPMLAKLMNLPRLDHDSGKDGPYALVLAPTRELAQQITEEAKKMAKNLNIRIATIIGGRSESSQSSELFSGVEALVCTTGRLCDMLDKCSIVLNRCFYLVIDEADKMVDMGFIEDLEEIIDSIPCTNLKSMDHTEMMKNELDALENKKLYRITQMFSATMPAAIEKLAKTYLRNPIVISIGDPGSGKREIKQLFEFVAENEKKNRLTQVLSSAVMPLIIFVNLKQTCDYLSSCINNLGYCSAVYHGGKNQTQREQALQQLKDSKLDILVCSDVASRGIDIKDLELVINYDMPEKIELYTHRIGRTGRAGSHGTSISFVTPQDSKIFKDLKAFLISTKNIVPLELSNV